MRMKKKNIIGLIASIALLSVLLIVCLGSLHTPPKMVDRTVGWSPSVVYSDSYELFWKTADDPFFQSYFFDGSSISIDIPVYVDLGDDPAVVMEKALSEAFPNDYIDIGTEQPFVKKKQQQTIVLYIGGETCVIVDSADGRVVQCIDRRIQKQFTDSTYEDFKKGFAIIKTDLTRLKASEVTVLDQYASGFSETIVPKRFAEQQACPLMAEQAFEAASKVLYKAVSSGQWKHLGDGAYIVYDAEASDCWLIVGKRFTLLLNKDTGEKAFFSVHMDGVSDRSVPLS